MTFPTGIGTVGDAWRFAAALARQSAAGGRAYVPPGRKA